MAMVLVVIAALCLVYGLLIPGSGAVTAGGLVMFLVGALLHMRNRRNEQLEAMRGRGNDRDTRNG